MENSENNVLLCTDIDWLYGDNNKSNNEKINTNFKSLNNFVKNEILTNENLILNHNKDVQIEQNINKHLESNVCLSNLNK